MLKNQKPSAAKRALGVKTASLAGNLPTYEHIVTDVNETFLWRVDDYPWERNVWNFHPEIEIHLIRNASGMAFVGDHIGEFHSGYLTVVGPNLPHDWVTATEPGELIPGRDVVIQFDPARVKAIAETLPEFSQLDAFFSRCERGLVFTGNTRRDGAEMIERMGGLKGFARLSLFIQLLELLSSSDEYEILSSPEFAPKLDAGNLDVLQRSLIYIFEHLASDIHIDEVAELAGMSESAFSRFFKKNTGNSFTDHVNKLRIWQACKLLSETDMPITDICFEVGYLNISNFNRTFLKQHKVTPSAYRKLTSQRRPVRALDTQSA
ncbi:MULTISPECIES: AraC family transcriptional regulator [unclassified Rhizobium]|uniref:AraC family transcriptional regulator n=1 Tax=unclassified Rhizobium TaxID=2613769 RepID=UPI0007137993|nr:MULTISPECIES: AraC family transcriptional regulator [unclassified Rhizobium]KQS91113.1 AraC family transcriptional regulator [Rhizobium sp. Leaf391]KQS96124.1 AraC family transcriptional regulator [Rhizobium sp. Leaf386]KQU09801.1 AraC family transcriptional regulator [Rhizobium sp. Leaf453]